MGLVSVLAGIWVTTVAWTLLTAKSHTKIKSNVCQHLLHAFVLHAILGTKLLYSTAYHPQTDGASERTNQTAEIALRYFIYHMDQPEMWPEVLPRIQAVLNNSDSASTNKDFNKVAFGFTLNRPMDLLLSSTPIDHDVARIEARDATWASYDNTLKFFSGTVQGKLPPRRRRISQEKTTKPRFR